MIVPFVRELFTVPQVVDKKKKNAPYEQRIRAIQEKLSETKWTCKACKAAVSNIKHDYFSWECPFTAEKMSVVLSQLIVNITIQYGVGFL